MHRKVDERRRLKHGGCNLPVSQEYLCPHILVHDHRCSTMSPTDKSQVNVTIISTA